MSPTRAACTCLLTLVSTVSMVLAAAQAQQDDLRKGGAVWGRNYFPNIELVSHEGKTLRFFDDLIEGKVVLINFIYTSCPDSCPLETAGLRQVQEILGDRVGKDVFFYSISIDPEVDTPEVLKQYAADYGVGPGWLFLTGEESDIVLLRRKLGLYMDEIAADGSRDHNLSLMMGNQATGRWMKRSPFENPYVLADQVGSWLHNWKSPSPQAGNDYADAPELRDITKGESLFRTRCTVCHDIGAGPVPAAGALKKVGPDLLDVTARREVPWLRRWLKEPDEVLAEGDSIALGLRAAYGIPMPNMQLNGREIDQLLEHIASVSAEVHARHAAGPAPGNADAPAQGTAPCCLKRQELALDGTGSPAPGDAETADAGVASWRWLGLSPGQLATVSLGLAFGLLSILLGIRRRALVLGPGS